MISLLRVSVMLLRVPLLLGRVLKMHSRALIMLLRVLIMLLRVLIMLLRVLIRLLRVLIMPRILVRMFFKGTGNPTCSAALSKSISIRHLCGISMRWSYGHGSSLPADGRKHT
jgi:hypothetical protein